MKTIEWKDGKVRFLDQTKLPNEELYIETDDESVLAEALRRLAIRGAPLIGITVAYGVVLALEHARVQGITNWRESLKKAIQLFTSTRPTAINLFWSLNRLERLAFRNEDLSIKDISEKLLSEAKLIHSEDEKMCRAIGKFGADILDMNCNVLTHCNTGALATGGIGTALGIIKTAWELGKIKHVYIDETRPLFQGSRLTAFEIQKLNIPATVITDSTAASLMLEKKVDAVIIGADRITRKGDVVNKIGSYNLAVLSKYHKIPFYVAAPSSTIDLQLVSGGEVPIEHRDSEELSKVGGARLTPQGFKIFSPAFDVTPFGLITAIVTEKGVWREIVGISLENFLESKG